jgi:hypothetical protein
MFAVLYLADRTALRMELISMPYYRRLFLRMMRTLIVLAIIAVANTHTLSSCSAAEVVGQNGSNRPDLLIDFSTYAGGPVHEWLREHGYRLERDAKNGNLLGLSITDQTFNIDVKARMSGFILNDQINLDNIKLIRINWGIKRYPKDVSYNRQVNNEALMLYIFFGKEKVSSGHVLIPNSPYFIGLFLCQDDEVNYPYLGRYFHIGGRFVCLGKPQPDQSIVSEFNLDQAFKSYFSKSATPGITGIGFGIDTSKAGDGGKGGAFIKTIQFIEHDRTK